MNSWWQDRIKIVVLVVCMTILLTAILKEIVGATELVDNFDATYYYIKYPDTAKLVGDNPSRLYAHYMGVGRREGRYPNASADPTTRLDLPFQTYVDVDIASQIVKYYKEGIQVMECPCVTGDVATHKDTPKGTWKVSCHTKGKWLNGPTWHNWVDYWMRFTADGCGFHDAMWRDDTEYVRETYLTNGSHGCVNLRHADADKLFEYIGVGTVVYVH